MITRTKWLWLGISTILLILSGLSIYSFPIPKSVDFAGGTVLEFQVENEEELDRGVVEEKIRASEVNNVNLRKTGEGTFLLKSEELSEQQVAQVEQGIAELGTYSELRRETVGPSVSADLTRKAIMVVIIAIIAIIIYIAYSFRAVPKSTSSWRFGLTAVFALVHDLIITGGAMALYGHFYGFELDSLFIVALLTIMGFSVHDTIVVFDRLRENLRQDKRSEQESELAHFERVANQSVIQTISRSINTSTTVLFTLLALYLLGGETVKNFMLALIVGISIGTYSSIFVATILLVVWQTFAHKKRAATEEKIA